MPNDHVDLTDAERTLIGNPDNWVSEQAVPARARSSTAMFSLRVDRATFEALGQLAELRGLTFSEVARDALRQYVATGGHPVSIAVGSLTIEAESVNVVQRPASRARPKSKTGV
jgi:antitoxin component of RelBE/YafQ-DinJ toxin-antitoxin module